KAALGICEKHGLSPMGFFMIGSPYETLEDMEKTEDFIRNYCKERFILYQTIAYPGTEVWNYALKNKIIQEDMYERKTKEFITKDARYLLTKEVSRENFEKIYKRINSLHTKKAGLDIAESLRNIKLKNMIFMLNLTFIKKAINLRKRFLNRIW
ncbi:MAG: hypothetical protein KKE50_04680, partial [Nanoarchaeota archaeon]|nr:hypothetical protein [Nanoarchaeota archaeon]